MKEKEITNYDLILYIYFRKFINILSNMGLFFIYFFIVFIVIILVNRLFSFNWKFLLENNFFIGFFSALIGGVIGLTGIIIQNKMSKKNEGLRYEYENIIIPYDQNYNKMLIAYQNLNYEEIVQCLNNSIKPFDLKYIINNGIKRYILLIEKQCLSCVPKKDKINILITTEIKSMLNMSSNLNPINLNVDEILKKIKSNTDMHLFESCGIEINEIYNPNIILQQKIQNNELFKELVEIDNSIFRKLISLKTYYNFYINNTKDKLYY